jgi:hypothetical protein
MWGPLPEWPSMLLSARGWIAYFGSAREAKLGISG